MATNTVDQLKSLSISLLVTLTLTVYMPSLSFAGSYRFTRIADNSSTSVFLSFAGGPSLNDKGLVTFATFVISGEGIFTGDGKQLRKIADSNDGFFTSFGGRVPVVDNKGTIAFQAHLVSGVNGIYLSNGDTAKTIADDTGPINFFGVPAINGMGLVAFRGNLDSGIDAIFTGDGSALNKIVELGDFFLSIGDPSLNDSGRVVFESNGTVVGTNGIFSIKEEVTSTVVDTTGLFGSFGNFPSLNNRGQVAFLAGTDNGDTGIFVSDGVSIRTVVLVGGAFERLFDPILNDKGKVAFPAIVNGVEGIFTGPNALADKVISVGDSLFGSEVVELDWGRQGFNRQGQVSLYARLANGAEVIVRADPVH